VQMGRIICGTNPVAIDAACAQLMGFDPLKIPAIANAFKVKQFLLCDFDLKDIEVNIDGVAYRLHNLPVDLVCKFEPQFGWKGHITNGQ